MACPHVSGVAALVLSYHKSSGYNPDMLRSRLESGKLNLDGYNSSYKGKLGGLVNAHAALASGSTRPPNTIRVLNSNVQSNIVTLSWTVPSDPDDGKPSGFNVYVRKTSLTGINVKNPPADVEIRTFPIGNFNPGDQFEVQVQGLDFDTRYYFAVAAFDFSGNFSSLSPQVSQTTLSNLPPTITVLDSTNAIVRAHQTVVLRFTGSDPDNHAIWWSVDPLIEGVSLIDMGDGQVQLSIIGKQVSPGKYNLELLLEDEYGAFAKEIVRFQVFENQPPAIVDNLNDLPIDGLSKEISFSIPDHFVDPDGELLRFTVENSAPHVVNVNENGGQLYIVSLAYGLARVTVTATDAMGLSVSQQFSVLVRDGSQEIDIYPNPVKDVVWIRTAENQNSVVTIYNSAGVKVFENEGNISPFAPLKVDMSSFSAGVYSVTIAYSGKNIYKQIVKL